MTCLIRNMLITAVMCTPLLLGACSSRTPKQGFDAYASSNIGQSTIINSTNNSSTSYDGQSASSTSGRIDTGLAVSNDKGQLAIVQGQPVQAPNAQFVNARELKLKVRELVDQMFNDMDNSAFNGRVTIPVAFADQENLNNSSAFGRLMAELLLYELGQRGFTVQEQRNSSTITLQENSGSSFFNTSASSKSVGNALVIAGTYYKDRDAVFVNARLIRPDNGHVLRTGNLILGTNNITTRMLAQKGSSLALSSTSVRGDKALPPVQVESAPFDAGADIH